MTHRDIMHTCRHVHTFFYGFLMCLSSFFPQEIQPGDHHKAVLGRKVSVCSCVCPGCGCSLLDVHAISPATGYALKLVPPAAVSVTWDQTF